MRREMIKYFILVLLLSTNVYASEFTANYNLEIPSPGDRDWQPIISKDIISIDTALGIVSADTFKIAIISTDLNAQIIKSNILSADVNVLQTKTTIISNDLAFTRAYAFPTSAPTITGSVISYDGADRKS